MDLILSLCVVTALNMEKNAYPIAFLLKFMHNILIPIV